MNGYLAALERNARRATGLDDSPVEPLPRLTARHLHKPKQTMPFVVYGVKAGGELIYIGQTSNLKQRFWQHAAMQSRFLAEATEIVILAGATTRDQIVYLESTLIGSVKPRYNGTYMGSAA